MLTPEQIQFRKTGIGGSDAAAIVGLSRYASPLDIYISKTTDAVKKTTAVMSRGHTLEPFVRNLFSQKTGFSVTTNSETIRSHEYDFMIANLDGFIPSENAVAEFKTCDLSRHKEWGEEGSDEIPQEYLIQVAHYASVMNVEKVYVGVIFGNDETFQNYMTMQNLIQKGHQANLNEFVNDLKVYIYHSDKDLQNKLIKKERAFWFDHVKKRIMPSLKDCTTQDLLKIYPMATEEQVRVGKIEIEELEKLKQLKLRKKELENEENKIKTQILKYFRNASILIDENNCPLATWKNKRMTTFDKEGLRVLYPELCDQFSYSIMTRELRVIL